jgi:hypothetical protein
MEAVVSERDDDKSGTLRITNQFRTKEGMAYDLKCDGVRLTLLVTAKTGSQDAGEWRIEARGSRTSERVAIVSAWGQTRLDALREVARLWPEAIDTQGLRTFDWEAVAKLLTTVRAV